MAAAGARINEARATVKAVRKVQADAPSFAIAGCHDAARKSITAHIVATGYRPKKCTAPHRHVFESASTVTVTAITDDALTPLSRPTRAHGDPADRTKRSRN